MREAVGWTGLFLCTAAATIGVNRLRYAAEVGIDQIVAWGLLGVNFVFFLAIRLLPARGGVWTEPVVGLLWVGLKLFVNTFTIFLFIGLQAVRTHVFVELFFGGYAVLLAGAVLLLNRKMNDDRTLNRPHEQDDSRENRRGE